MAVSGDIGGRVSRPDPSCATSEAVAGIDSGPGGSLTSAWGDAGLIAMTPPLPSPFPVRGEGGLLSRALLCVTCVTHVPWCMPGSLTSDFLWSRWRGKRSRHSRRTHNPQFYVSGKRPKTQRAHQQYKGMPHGRRLMFSFIPLKYPPVTNALDLDILVSIVFSLLNDQSFFYNISEQITGHCQKSNISYYSFHYKSLTNLELVIYI